MFYVNKVLLKVNERYVSVLSDIYIRYQEKYPPDKYPPDKYPAYIYPPLKKVFKYSKIKVHFFFKTYLYICIFIYILYTYYIHITYIL